VSDVEEVVWDNQVIAIIMRRDVKVEDVKFISPPDYPLQVGVIRRSVGYTVRPHIHNRIPKQVDSVQEVLHIEEGSVEVEFFTPEGEVIGSRILNMGDTIILGAIGHGLKILEDTKIFEVKQGPYMKDKDKVYFDER